MIRNIDTKLSAFVVALGLAALCGCSDEFGNGWGSKGNTTLTATIDQAGVQSRTCIDPKSYDGGVVGLLWTPDDCLGVFGTNTQNARFANQSTTNVSQASFSGNLADGELPQYAYYPYSEANINCSADNLVGTVSAIQTFDLDKGQLSDDWKYGTLKRTTSAGYEFQMNHLFAMAKVTVNATGSALKDDALQSVSVTVTAGDGTENVRRINGDFTFSAEDGKYQLTGTASEGSNTTNMVWSDKPSLTSGKSYTGYLTLIPNVEAGDKFTICLTTDKHTATYEVKSKVNFQKGSIYNFPLNLTYLAETMMNDYGKVPTITEISTEPGTDPEPTVTTGTFTACAFNVDGLPQKLTLGLIPVTINGDGPGSSGTTTMAGIANNLGWDIIAASEDFEYNKELVAALTNYSHGTWRGTVTSAQLSQTADTDGLNFFWRTSTTSATGETYVQYTDAEGGLTSGANTCIKKGFRHYEVTVDAKNNVVIDVYITHMNTYSGSGNTESNAYVKAVLSQLRQLRDYVLENAKANKRPAIIMGDTNMRYTRHDIKTNFLDVVAAYDNNAGYTVSDPWVEFHRGGIYPSWDSKSLMIRAHANKDGISSDIICADDQRGEVVDKIWYINVPGAEVQLKATAHKNDVDNFKKQTTSVSFSGATLEDANGNVTENQSITYDKVVGYSDHFPVVTTFQWTKTTTTTK